MRTPTPARSTTARFTVLLASTLLLAACNGEVTNPTASAPPANIERPSLFVPSAVSKALIGVTDGTYAVTFDPTHDQSFSLGPNHLDIPANAVCNLLTSGYGSAYWDKSCTPQTLPVTLTIVIKNASSDKPSIQFFPAMRFNPTKNVELYMYAPHVSKNDAKNWLMYYCPDSGKGNCVNESLTDTALTTYIDYTANVLYRRVKHFSGYVVAEFCPTNDGSGGGY